jgi:hypothetical protein
VFKSMWQCIQVYILCCIDMHVVGIVWCPQQVHVSVCWLKQSGPV